MICVNLRNLRTNILVFWFLSGTDLSTAGGKGSHRNPVHPSGVRITVSGSPGDDAKLYQERDLERALERS